MLKTSASGTAEQDNVRQRNRYRIIATLRGKASASQREIGDETGLSAATVSSITKELLADEIIIVAEPAVADKQRGRPKVRLALNGTRASVCTIFFQLNAVTARLVNYAGLTLTEVIIPLAGTLVDAEQKDHSTGFTRSEIQHVLLDAIEQIAVSQPPHHGPLLQVAVGFQGVADVAGRSILWSPITAERDLPVCDWVETRFDVPCSVANDCDMIVRGLTHQNHDLYGDNFGAVLLSYGVGMGLFLRGEIVNGTRSSGIELGHMTYEPNGALCRCGNSGCVEAYAADYAILRTASNQPADTPPSQVTKQMDLKAVAKAALAGDKKALSAVQQAGAAVGTSLASLFALVDAFPVAIVGHSSALFSLIEPAIVKALSTAPGFNPEGSYALHHVESDTALVNTGCMLAALRAQDEAFAHRSAKVHKLDYDNALLLAGE